MDSAAALRWETHDDLPAAEALLIDAGLHEFNVAAAPLGAVQPLACLARRANGDVVGGAVGRTWGACGELQQLWVASKARRQGIGAGLVRQFETRAAERGCRVVYLETFSFQAPALYVRLGYEVAARIAGFPNEIVKLLMLRTLELPPEPALQRRNAS